MEARSLPGNDYDSSEDEESPEKSPSNQEFEQRTTSERHVFFFRHTLNPSAPELTDFHPLPSQIPFLLDVFSENVNFTIQVVHMPTINRMVRDARESGMTSLTPADEALMFSIYYAAIASMEEDDVSPVKMQAPCFKQKGLRIALILILRRSWSTLAQIRPT